MAGLWRDGGPSSVSSCTSGLGPRTRLVRNTASRYELTVFRGFERIVQTIVSAVLRSVVDAHGISEAEDRDAGCGTASGPGRP
jgi:hypothetical protein